MSCQTGCNESFSINACNAALACEVSAEDYLNKLRTELPRGLLWDIDDERNVSKFWQSIASTFAWLHNTICSTVNETFPCATEDLLERQADLWNYPTECLGYPDTADQLCEWIQITTSECWGYNLHSMRALIAFAGIDFVQSIEEVAEAVDPCAWDICSPIGEECFSSYSACPSNCRVNLVLDESFFDNCVMPDPCCWNICQTAGGYYDKKGLDCLMGKYFGALVPIYIIDPNGTQSILIEPPSTCY